MTEMAGLSPIDSSNTSITGESLQGSIANMGRMDETLQAILGMLGRWTDAGTIASATTCDIGAQPEGYLNVTGTTTITGLGTVRNGTIRFLKFAGALTLTHNATSLILPGDANITTSAGDKAIFVSKGSGNWECLAYTRISGGIIKSADQAQQESGGNNTMPVTPSVQQYHPSAAKAWARVTESGGTYTLSAAYNIASVVKNATGNVTVSFTVPFSSAAYAASVTTNSSGTLAAATSPAAGSIVVRIFNTTPTAVDNGFYLIVYGDQ